MASERTLVTDPARVNPGTSIITNQKGVMWYLANQLAGVNTGGVVFTTGIWSVVGSSDGTTAALDGVNRWTSPTNIVFANPGTAHSWIILRHTGLGLYFRISGGAGTSGTGNNTVFGLSKNAYTGGSITADPTTTNEETVTLTVSDASTFGASHMEMTLSDNGAFYCVGSRDTTVTFNFFFGIPSLVEVNGSDVGAVACMVAAAANSGGVLLASALELTSANTTIKQRDKLGTGSATGTVYVEPSIAKNYPSDAISGNAFNRRMRLFWGGGPGARGRIQDWTWANALTQGEMTPTNWASVGSDKMVCGGVWLGRVATVPALY